ncbi:unnamed protein product, partial [Meganyctiphanes norvegica]
MSWLILRYKVCKMNILRNCKKHTEASCIREQNTAEDAKVLVSHQFKVHSYKRPTYCAYCSTMLYGLIRQGKQCQLCRMNIHKKCEKQIESSCNRKQGCSVLIREEANNSCDVSHKTRMNDQGIFSSDAVEIKWMLAFDHCRQQLGLTRGTSTSLHKVWGCLGSIIQSELEASQFSQ